MLLIPLGLGEGQWQLDVCRPQGHQEKHLLFRWLEGSKSRGSAGINLGSQTWPRAFTCSRSGAAVMAPSSQERLPFPLACLKGEMTFPHPPKPPSLLPLGLLPLPFPCLDACLLSGATSLNWQIWSVTDAITLSTAEAPVSHEPAGAEDRTAPGFRVW